MFFILRVALGVDYPEWHWVFLILRVALGFILKVALGVDYSLEWHWVLIILRVALGVGYPWTGTGCFFLQVPDPWCPCSDMLHVLDISLEHSNPTQTPHKPPTNPILPAAAAPSPPVPAVPALQEQRGCSAVSEAF